MMSGGEIRLSGSVNVDALVELSETDISYLRLMAEASGRSVQDELLVIIDNAIRMFIRLGAKEHDNREGGE